VVQFSRTSYDPEAKGKIERFFGTVSRRFYPLLAENPPKILEDLNERFWQWLELDYHRKVHSALEMCPLDIFIISSILCSHGQWS
jgi:transposase InsO family protein